MKLKNVALLIQVMQVSLMPGVIALAVLFFLHHHLAGFSAAIIAAEIIIGATGATLEKMEMTSKLNINLSDEMLDEIYHPALSLHEFLAKDNLTIRLHYPGPPRFAGRALPDDDIVQR